VGREEGDSWVDGMTATPTDWVELVTVNGREYGCSINYDLWDMDSEEVLYDDEFLRDVVDDKVHWETGEKFTLRDLVQTLIADGRIVQ